MTLSAYPPGAWTIADLPQPHSDRPTAIPGRIAYVLYASLPYLSTGYAIRSQAVATALKRLGADIHCVTRPGFPWDEQPKSLLHPAPIPALAQNHVIDGVPYCHLPTPLFDNWLDYRGYILRATDVLIERLRVLRPALVMAASSHACALPALGAARALKLPMVYDMRGMWELSRAAREPAFDNSAQFRYEQSLETTLAQQADHVFTLSQPMRDAMIDRGVAADKVTFLPNGCDPSRFGPAGRGLQLKARLQIPPEAPIIGYMGSFPAYEGLADLVTAAALLKERGHNFRLVLAGDENGTGEHGISQRQLLMQHAERLNVADRLILVGRVSGEHVADFMDIFDIITVPRQSLPVTEMVAPLKPTEAMMAGKPVVVSSVAGMAGLIRHGETGMIFTADQPKDLAGALGYLLTYPNVRTRLAHKARSEALTRFSWDEIAKRMLQTIRRSTAS